MHVWATPSLKLAVKKKLRHCLDTLRRGPKLIIAKRYLMKLFVVESLKSIFFHVKSKMLVKLQVIDHYCYWQVFFLFPGLGLCGSTCLTFKLSFVFCQYFEATGQISHNRHHQLYWLFPCQATPMVFCGNLAKPEG